MKAEEETNGLQAPAGQRTAANAQVTPDDAGLSAAQAAQALQDDGPNELPDAQKRGLLAIARETLSDPMFALLLAAGMLYLVLGDLQEGLVLFGLVLVVLALTLYQEGKTERAIESLRDLTSPRALVLRDGAALRIAGREVVRGDVLMLAEGDRVPADALLVQGTEVQVDESLLTGEPVPVDKVAGGVRTDKRRNRARTRSCIPAPCWCAGTAWHASPPPAGTARSAASARRWAA